MDRYRSGHKTHVLISRRGVKNRGNVDEFNVEWNVRQGFLQRTGYWETHITHQARRLTVNVILPSSRSPQHTTLIESNRQRSCDLVKQVRLKRGHCAAIAARFASELLQRDGRLASKWQQDDGELPPAIRLPMRLTVPMYTWPEAQSGARVDLSEQWALAYLAEGLQGQWQDPAVSPLLTKTNPETYRFLNREVFGFLICGLRRCSSFTQYESRFAVCLRIERTHYSAMIMAQRSTESLQELRP